MFSLISISEGDLWWRFPMVDVDSMSFAVSSNGKGFEVGLWIGVNIDDIISSNNFGLVVLVYKRKELTHIDIIWIEIDSK